MIPIRKTLEADVVIAGGGIGGAMAAISAREAGAERVVVLEKGSSWSRVDISGNEGYMKNTYLDFND